MKLSISGKFYVSSDTAILPKTAYKYMFLDLADFGSRIMFCQEFAKKRKSKIKEKKA